MNNPNFRKRRPYGHEGDPGLAGLPGFSGSQDPSPSYPAVATPLGVAPPVLYTSTETDILYQTAAILNCSLTQLYDLDSRTLGLPYLAGDTHVDAVLDTKAYTHAHTPAHAHAQARARSSSFHSYNVSTKRPRLSTDFATMPPPQEKTPPASVPVAGPMPVSVPVGQHGSAPQGQPLDGFPLAFDSSSFAQCLASFSVCAPCITCEPQGYAPIPSASPYSYSETQAYPDPKPPQPSPENSMSYTLSPGQPGVFEANSPLVARQMFPGYPVLQPGRPLAIQPTTSDQAMVYPTAITLPTQLYPSVSELQSSPPISPSSHIMRVQQFPTPSSDVREGFAKQYSGPEPQVHNGVDRARGPRQSRPIDIMQTHQRPMPSKRGPFRNQEEREKTAETRRIGSCIRCRMQRIRCEQNPEDKTGTCLTCQRVSNVKVWRMPCLRYKITDVRLFKPGQVKGHEWTRRWVEGVADDISHWASTETRKVKVTEGYTEHPVELRVRQFVPQEGDSLERSWVYEGVRKRVSIPAYAIVNLEEAKAAYSNHISRSFPECCKSVLSGKDKLLLATYWAALKTMRDPGCDGKEKELLKKALQLWMAIRLTTKSTVIVGEETLGMSADIMDETSPLNGKIPLPPVMGAQIELVLIHQIQSTLRREMLESLQSMTQANKQQTWYTTYLITFILLHNVALLCQHDSAYARKHGMKARFAREEMVREYQMGANVLLAYFHYCNKGIYPFSPECKEQDLITLAGLDEQKLQLIRQTKYYVERHRKPWAKLRESRDYENDVYYISQLFEENWIPQATI
ncbi:hypothetical protein F5Y17DRAFT_466511 [Xylariaceae sp. FL0594]|nr:hypothetical protein F5Y17DRAFT_466511 [Xylariaceae sp. FL0594]